MKVAVVTCSHRGDDARIVHRQARALIDTGHSVTLIAPDPGSASRQFDPVPLERVFVRRSVGRRRIGGWVDSRRALLKVASSSDVVIIHDPELIPVCLSIRATRGKRLWDVHEDFVAVAEEVSWLPRLMRGSLVRVVKALLWLAHRRFSIIVAEKSYLRTFPGAVVVPNTPTVSDEVPGTARLAQAVYVGRISFDRGAEELTQIGRRLAEVGGPRIVLVGSSDAECEEMVASAARNGWVNWRGPVANPDAVSVMAESMAGLCLLRNTRNYQDSYPTKIGEYMSVGLPVIATPLPLARSVLEASGGGLTTMAWGGVELVDEVVAALTELTSDGERARAMGVRGWSYAVSELNWHNDSKNFLAALQKVLTPNPTHG